jgi:hypothetical protein
MNQNKASKFAQECFFVFLLENCTRIMHPSFLLYFLLLHVPWTPQEAKKRKNQFPPPLITGNNFFLCPSCCSDEEEKEVKNGPENAHILYTQQQPQQQIWLQIFLLYFKLLLHR